MGGQLTWMATGSWATFYFLRIIFSDAQELFLAQSSRSFRLSQDFGYQTWSSSTQRKYSSQLNCLSCPNTPSSMQKNIPSRDMNVIYIKVWLQNLPFSLAKKTGSFSAPNFTVTRNQPHLPILHLGPRSALLKLFVRKTMLLGFDSLFVLNMFPQSFEYALRFGGGGGYALNHTLLASVVRNQL